MALELVTQFVFLCSRTSASCTRPLAFTSLYICCWFDACEAESVDECVLCGLPAAELSRLPGAKLKWVKLIDQIAL